MSDSEDYQAEVRQLRAELAALRAGETGRHLSAVPDAKPRRITLSELVEQLIAAQSRHGGERSSVKLTRNARGDTQIEVTVRTGDSSGIETVEDCAAEANRVYESLRMLYPMSDAPNVSGGPHSGGKA